MAHRQLVTGGTVTAVVMQAGRHRSAVGAQNNLSAGSSVRADAPFPLEFWRFLGWVPLPLPCTADLGQDVASH